MQPSLPALVVMGVAGCGKSSVSEAVLRHTGGVLIEGDDFHPQANIDKMSAGIPLTDEDRAGWLARLVEELTRAVRAGQQPVLACSALKRKYRDQLRAAVPELGFAYLELSREDASARMLSRSGHFMPTSLIHSQFAALEPPHNEPHTLVVDARLPIDELGRQIAEWWREPGQTRGRN
jgi:gluconokinase